MPYRERNNKKLFFYGKPDRKGESDLHNNNIMSIDLGFAVKKGREREEKRCFFCIYGVKTIRIHIFMQV